MRWPGLNKTVSHVEFRVDCLAEAIKGEDILPGPYEPIDDYFVAIINDAGVPIELIQTLLTDEELWQRARAGKGSLYCKGKSRKKSHKKAKAYYVF